MNKKLVVYTCITGGYDKLAPPRVCEPSIDYICFTDNPDLDVNGWEYRPLPRQLLSYEESNRFVKMNPHIVFPEYELSIYVDGNIEIVGDLTSLINQALITRDIALYEHPFRDCIYMEATECAAIGHDWYWKIKKQMNTYILNGYPARSGMFECGVIIRRHNSKVVKSLMDAWWSAYQKGVKRDQLSLPYLAYRLDVRIQNLGKSDYRFSRANFSIAIGHHRKANQRMRMRGFINRKFIQYFS